MEMLLYFVLAIMAMSYFIFITVDKMPQPAGVVAGPEPIISCPVTRKRIYKSFFLGYNTFQSEL